MSQKVAYKHVTPKSTRWPADSIFDCKRINRRRTSTRVFPFTSHHPVQVIQELVMSFLPCRRDRFLSLVMREEVIRGEVIREEVTREDARRGEVIREEGIREESIKEEVIREEVIRGEVIREEVMREEVIREEERSGYKRRGYKRSGYRISGYKISDRSGYKRSGYKRRGHKRRGYKRRGEKRSGYRISGYKISEISGYKRSGYKRSGYKRKRREVVIREAVTRDSERRGYKRRCYKRREGQRERLHLDNILGPNNPGEILLLLTRVSVDDEPQHPTRSKVEDALLPLLTEDVGNLDAIPGDKRVTTGVLRARDLHQVLPLRQERDLLKNVLRRFSGVLNIELKR